jgi:hypothetical protein
MTDFVVTNSDPRFRILNTLDEIISKVRLKITKPHHFRFVSSGQAKQAEMALYRWALAGRIGPQPTVDHLSFRAAMYNQASTSAILAAFHKAACTTTWFCDTDAVIAEMDAADGM